MAENKLINVRINHKFDTYANWMTSTVTLGAGELAVALIDSGVTSSGLTPPTIGVKIGDGSKTFKDLDWIQAIAGDVHPWAKKENLEYADLTDEFLEEIKGLVNDEVQDTNTTYVFTYENDKLKIQSKEKGSDELKDVIEFTITDSTKINAVKTATVGNIAQFAADGQLADSGEKISDYLKSADAEGLYAPLSLEEDFSDLDARVTALDAETTGRVSVLEDKMDVLNGEATVEGSVKKQVADAIAGVVASAPEDFDTLKEIADYIASDKTGAAELVARVTANETAIANLEEVALSKTASLEVLNAITAEDVAAWNAAEQNAKDYAKGLDDAQTEVVGGINTRLTTAEGKIATLEEVVGDTEEGLVHDVASLQETAHSHDNKTTLDGITDAKVTAWDAAIQAGNGVEVDTTGEKPVVSGVSTDLLKTGTNELILECGTSA